MNGKELVRPHPSGKKVFDIVRPGKTMASPNSRPMLGSQKADVPDDQFMPSGAPDMPRRHRAVAPHAARPLLTHADPVVMEPVDPEATTAPAVPTGMEKRPLSVRSPEPEPSTAPPVSREAMTPAAPLPPSAPAPAADEFPPAPEERNEPASQPEKDLDALLLDIDMSDPSDPSDKKAEQAPAATSTAPAPTPEPAPNPAGNAVPAEFDGKQSIPLEMKPAPESTPVARAEPEKAPEPTQTPEPDPQPQPEPLRREELMAGAGMTMNMATEDEDEEEERRAVISHHKRKGMRWWAWLLIFLAALLLATAAADLALDAELISVDLPVPYTNFLD